MKVIILSAGIGSRLKPLTANVPKSMLLIDSNTTVLERTINIINNNIKNAEIIIVNGFCKDKINDCVAKYSNCKTIHNPFFRITNSISSLWFAREFMDDDTIFINADVIVEERLFRYMLTKKDSFVLYDSSIGDMADYKVSVKDGEIVVMSKDLNKFSGEYVGITKLTKEDTIKLRRKIESMVKDEMVNEWYETAMVDMIFTENFKLKAVDACDYSWTEIDNVNDLIKAKEIFKFDSLKEGNK